MSKDRVKRPAKDRPLAEHTQQWKVFRLDEQRRRVSAFREILNMPGEFFNLLRFFHDGQGKSRS